MGYKHIEQGQGPYGTAIRHDEGENKHKVGVMAAVAGFYTTKNARGLRRTAKRRAKGIKVPSESI